MDDKKKKKGRGISNTERLDVYADIAESVGAIVDYDSTQFFWRGAAITLIIGNLATVGFFLGALPGELLFSAQEACLWVGLIFLVLNFCITWLDLFKAEKLSLSCVHNILKIEKKYSWLFPIFANTKDEKGRRHGAMEKKIHFYIKCGNNIILVSTAASLYSFGLEGVKAVWPVVTVLIASVLTIYLHSQILERTFARVEDFAEKFLSRD